MYFVFFFNDTATTEIYTLSLHDALPICRRGQEHARLDPGDRGERGDPRRRRPRRRGGAARRRGQAPGGHRGLARSEEHTSELQSRQYLVCRLLLEKKKKQSIMSHDE